MGHLQVKNVPDPVYLEFEEHCEVFLVAIIVAVAIRSYFLQPFKIPTGSMQPTLNGIIGHPSTDTPPNFARPPTNRARATPINIAAPMRRVSKRRSVAIAVWLAVCADAASGLFCPNAFRTRPVRGKGCSHLPPAPTSIV